MCSKPKSFGTGAIPEIRRNKADVALVHARLLHHKLVNGGSRLIGFYLINADDVSEDSTAFSIFGLPLESIESGRCESASTASFTSGKGFR